MSDIRELREAAGLSQAELAARTRIAQPHISAYETGRRTVTPDVLERVKAATKLKPSEVLAAHRDEVISVVQENRGTAVRVFGSVARGDDTVESDLDLLVDFTDDADLLDQIGIEQDLRALLQVDVDVVSARGLRGEPGAAIDREAVPV